MAAGTKGTNLFKNLHEHGGVIETMRNQVIDMSRIGNVQGELNGDVVSFSNITGIALTENDRETYGDKCGNSDFKCVGSENVDLTMNKILDDTYILKNCRVNRLANLSGDSANDIIQSAVSKFTYNQMVLEAKNHLNVVGAGLNEYVKEETENGIYEIIEGMITKVETENATSISSISRNMDVVVLVSPVGASEIRKQKLGCCENLLSGVALSTIDNAWGVKDVVPVPANIMPTGVDIMVYVIDWALFGYACKEMSVYDGMSEKTKNWKVMSLFEEYGSKLIGPSDFGEIALNPGEKYSLTVVVPPISESTEETVELTAKENKRLKLLKEKEKLTEEETEEIKNLLEKKGE